MPLRSASAAIVLALAPRALAELRGNAQPAAALPWNHSLLEQGSEHVNLVTQYEGAEVPEMHVESNAGGETHIFAIGDWGTLLPGHLTAPNVRPRGSKNKCPEKCEYVEGIDDRAQLLVAAAMKSRAAKSNPQYVLNVGDSFYWGGITQPCGVGLSSVNGHTMREFGYVWTSVYGSLTNKPWISALGNHDYGGYMYSNAWDQIVAYSRVNPNWVMPARYFSRKMVHPGFTVEYFVIDSNAMDAKEPGEDPEHNICGEAHNIPGASCASVGGPSSPKHCKEWFWSSYRTQQAWLERRLAASSADWQVVVTHFHCYHEAGWYQKLHNQYGLDLLVTGHRHAQEIHSIGGLACFVTGGGGGVTSEHTPKGEFTDQYGFFDLTLSKDSILLESVNLHGKVVDSKIVKKKQRLLLL